MGRAGDFRIGLIRRKSRLGTLAYTHSHTIIVPVDNLLPERSLTRRGAPEMIPEFTHAPFVWSSYGLFVVVMAWQFLQPMLRRRKLIRSLEESIAERRAARRMAS